MYSFGVRLKIPSIPTWKVVQLLRVGQLNGVRRRQRNGNEPSAVKRHSETGVGRNINQYHIIGIGSYSSSQWHSVKNHAHSVKDLMDFF